MKQIITKRLHLEFWGGTIEVSIVKFNNLPNKARYKYSDYPQ